MLECITQGLSNKEIAWNLRITEKTVKSHVSTILDKLGLESRTQAALHATRLGLVRTEPAVTELTPRLLDRRVVPIDLGRRKVGGAGALQFATA